MTRKQLLERRKRRKKMLLIRRVATAVLAVAALILVVVLAVKGIGRLVKGISAGRTEETVEEEEPVELETDTAIRETVPLELAGNEGWNVDDKGWWYQNPDGTKYVNGWKTIEGFRYYFGNDGYLPTGWIATEVGKDTYFDQAGIPDLDAVPKLVAITYDDGPSQNTDTILEVLEKYNAKATFFVVGIQADYYTDELLRAVEDGMEIGSHTYEHLTLKGASAEEIRKTMEKNDDLIERLCGFRPVIMRPTGGGVDDTVANNVGKPMILWDVDTLDWKTRDAANTVEEIRNQVKDGSIILMHDLFQATAEATKELVPMLQGMGYKLVTVSELAEAYGYELEDGKEYYDFYPENAPG